MPQQFDDFEDDDDFADDQPSQDSTVLRQMRKQIKELSRANKELSSENGSLKAAGRERSIAEVLTSKGLNPKIAKFIPADLEPTPEALTGWVSDFADVFGVATPAPETPEPAPEQAAAYQRMRQVEDTGQTATGEAAITQRLAAAGNAAELMDIMRQHGGAAV